MKPALRYLLLFHLALLSTGCGSRVKPPLEPDAPHRPWGILGATIYQEDNGQKISSLVMGGPAATAGILRGDLITAIDGKTFGSTTSLIRYVRATLPGTICTLNITRGWENRLSFKVTIGTFPQDEQLYTMGLKALEAMDYQRAKDLFEKIIRKYPGSRHKLDAGKRLQGSLFQKKNTLAR